MARAFQFDVVVALPAPSDREKGQLYLERSPDTRPEPAGPITINSHCCR